MCYYITAVVPDEAHLEQIQKMLESYDLKFNEIINPYILNQLSNRYIYFRPTTSVCDCDSELGKSNGCQKNEHKSTISKLQKKVGANLKLIVGLKKEKIIKSKPIRKSNLQTKRFGINLL
ncbi:Uncharacterized protein XB16_3108 [Leptospira santarosai]|uniref:Uncharacterized protein n=1 Tax=Leptospira santarosai TaxID=28183 RepID=A0A2P1QWV9_9LEPT|nr:Uncharacterized protein XB16_3108 [Leptospira santarosai]